MSHQTGIKANEALKKNFAQSKNGKIRALKISIVNEQLALNAQQPVSRSWEDDFRCVADLVVEDDPCYILYRLDSRNISGYDWLLISWTPDTSPVRQKMLYASTKATLKQEFGSSDIKEELHATTLEEVSLHGYARHKADLTAPAPLTNREEEMKELRKSEIAGASEVGIDTKQQTMTGLSFPISSDAKKAILDLASNKLDYVQIRIDIESESIQLVESSKLKINQLSSRIPKNNARYHLFLFRHTHEGDYIESIVFIYSMPESNCSIKERMLYSSCKGPLLDAIAALGVEVSKKLEVDADEDLNEQFLMDEVHPKVNLHRPKFDKPKGPPNRGAKRITKQQ